MKTKLFTIFALAAILMACDNNNEPKVQATKKYIPGEEVILAVGMPSGQSANVCPRKIKGTYAALADNQYQMSYYWETGDTLGVEYNGKWATFEMVEMQISDVTQDVKSNGWAIFKGYMPEGYAEGEKFNVACGPITVPEIQLYKDANTLYSHMMRFEAEECSFGEDIQLYAAWSIVRIGVKLTAQIQSQAQADMEGATCVVPFNKIEFFEGNIEESTTKSPAYTFNAKSGGDKWSHTVANATTTYFNFVVKNKTWNDGFAIRTTFDYENAECWKGDIGSATQVTTVYATSISGTIQNYNQSITFDANKAYPFADIECTTMWDKKAE